MKHRLFRIWAGIMFALVTALCVAPAAVAQCAAAATTKSPFVGKWDGERNGIPGVSLIVADADGGTIGGVVIFYFQTRGNDGEWRVAGKFVAPLLNLHAESNSKTLTFEVQHHKTHDSPEFGPNARFRMELTKSGEATLENLDEDSPGPVKIRRRD